MEQRQQGSEPDGGADDGTSGFYLTFEQELGRENPSVADDVQAQTLFVHVGTADRDISDVDLHTSAGVTWKGAIATRDDVVVPEPMYLTYEATFRAAGANVIRVPMRPENEFHLDPADLAKAITPKTTAIVFATR